MWLPPCPFRNDTSRGRRRFLDETHSVSYRPRAISAPFGSRYDGGEIPPAGGETWFNPQAVLEADSAPCPESPQVSCLPFLRPCRSRPPRSQLTPFPPDQ